MSEFAGKAVLITGGTSGIGKAAALAFASRGANVLVAGRNAERGESTVAEVARQGGTAVYVQADVSRREDTRKVIGEAVRRFGRLDCAFNNAATGEGTFKPIADFTEEEYDHAMALDLKSVWLSMKFELEQMAAQDPKGGSIVNTSSVNGLGGSPLGALYSAAKAGILAFTKSAAREYAKDGIRINALAAGGFRTPMLEGVFDRASQGDSEKRGRSSRGMSR